MDRIFVFQISWNWHEIYLWLLPIEIQPYLGRIFTSMPSGIIKLQNCSLVGHFPEFALALWQVGINNCIFFPIFTDCSKMPCPTPISISNEVVALTREDMRQSVIAGYVGLTHSTVNHIIRRHAGIGTLVPGRSTGATSKTTPRQDSALLRTFGQDRFISAWDLTVWLRYLYEMIAGQKPINNRLGSCPMVTLTIGPQGSPCWLLTTAASVGTEVAEPENGPLATCHLRWRV